MMIRVVAPHFVAGMIYDDEADRITRAAPILKWAIGKSQGFLMRYFDQKGWDYAIVDPLPPIGETP